MGEFVQYGTIVEVWDDYHYCRYHNLVGGLEHFLFSHILGLSSSQLTNIFQMGWNHQPVMVSKSQIQLIGLRERLQENPIFHGKIYGFL